MIYTVRVKATRRNLGDFEAPDPCQALAAMLVSRGVSSGSGDLLARVLDGLEAVPIARDFADALARLGSASHAEISGRLAGLEFREAEGRADQCDHDRPLTSGCYDCARAPQAMQRAIDEARRGVGL